ncbi:MAG: type IV pilus modification PilV family protein [Kiritimatiellia bacterium]
MRTGSVAELRTSGRIRSRWPVLPVRGIRRGLRQVVVPCGAAFTLIEVLVAVVILSTGIVLVLRAFDASVVALSEARDTMRAAALLRERIVLTTLDVRSAADYVPPTRSGRFEDPYRDFHWNEEANTVAGSGPTVSYELVETVWRDGSDRRFTTRTYVTVEPQSARKAR